MSSATIAAVEAFVLVGDKDYVGGAGLRPPARAEGGPTRATAAVVRDVLTPLLIGADPLAIEAHWERMYGSMRLRGHVAGYQLEAIAGVDIALWDLAGKLVGLPAYRLLGGPFTTELPSYASGVPGRTVEERAASAERFIAHG